MKKILVFVLMINVSFAGVRSGGGGVIVKPGESTTLSLDFNSSRFNENSIPGLEVIKPDETITLDGSYELSIEDNSFVNYVTSENLAAFNIAIGQNVDWSRGQAIKDQLINEALEPSDSKKKKIIEQNLSDIIEITLKDGSVIKLD